MDYANQNHYYYLSSENDNDFIASYTTIAKEISEWTITKHK